MESFSVLFVHLKSGMNSLYEQIEVYHLEVAFCNMPHVCDTMFILEWDF
jgi:hypothetical protein